MVLSLNRAANFPNIAALSASLLSLVYGGNKNFSDTAYVFYNEISEIRYNELARGVKRAMEKLATGDNSSFRILMTVPDGTVVIDTAKGSFNGKVYELGENTWANFKAKTINENHHTRPEFLISILGETGIGAVERYSTSINTYEHLQVTRFGASPQRPYGFVRVGLNSDIEKV
jgi:hypothetical protein